MSLVSSDVSKKESVARCNHFPSSDFTEVNGADLLLRVQNTANITLPFNAID